MNDLRMNLDRTKPSILVLLDLSAAFDTVDHSILLDRLHNQIGISGSVFNWFKSYLTDRKMFVSMEWYSSKSYKITCGVPQVSILGPTVFKLYMLQLRSVIRKHGINFHSYADDTQLYITVSPDDPGPIDGLFNCILDTKSWMAKHFLQLNQDKTEVLFIGSEAQRQRINIQLKALALNPTSQVKSLGVILDSDLSFNPHIRNI